MKLMSKIANKEGWLVNACNGVTSSNMYSLNAGVYHKHVTNNIIGDDLLLHICIIQLYCIEDNPTVNPRIINTDVVEWFFGNARSMAGRLTNKTVNVNLLKSPRKIYYYNIQHLCARTNIGRILSFQSSLN